MRSTVKEGGERQSQSLYNCFNKSRAMFSLVRRLVRYKWRALKHYAVHNCFKSRVMFSLVRHLVCYTCIVLKKEAQCGIYNCFNKSRAMFSLVRRLVCYIYRVLGNIYDTVHNCFKSRVMFSLVRHLVCYACIG